MCYANCIYENRRGECKLRGRYPSDAFCQEDENEPMEEKDNNSWEEIPTFQRSNG